MPEGAAKAPNMLPTEEQLERFFGAYPDFDVIFSLPRLVDRGIVTRSNFLRFMDFPRRYIQKMGMSVVVIPQLVRELGVAGLVRLGRFDEIDPDFDPANFSIDEEYAGKIDFELVRSETYIHTDEITNIIKVRGLRKSGIIGLLHFAVKYPRKQEQFPVAALDAVYVNPRGERFVAVLSSRKTNSGSKRTLLLVHESCLWHPECRFLAEAA